MTTSTIRIERLGAATETVATSLTAGRAYDLAQQVRRRLQPGERLFVETAHEFTVIAERA